MRPKLDERKVQKSARIPKYLWDWADRRIDERLFNSYNHIVEVAMVELRSRITKERRRKGK